MSLGSGKNDLVASFVHLDSLLAAIQEIQAAGLSDFEVFSPIPRHEIQDMLGKRKSPVRFLTFFGGLAGIVSAFGLTMLTSLIWNLVVGGKPILSIPPFLVPVFELTILFAGVATLFGVFFLGRMPGRTSAGYHPSFSDDRFGLSVSVPSERVDQVRALLEAHRPERCWLVENQGDHP